MSDIKRLKFFFWLAPFLILSFTGNKTAQEPKEFSFVIDNSVEQTIKLECLKGCAWKELSTSCDSSSCSIKIDQFGMYREENTAKAEELADFIIEVSRAGNTYSFECSKGCAWIELGVSSIDINKNFLNITEKGLEITPKN